MFLLLQFREALYMKSNFWEKNVFILLKGILLKTKMEGGKYAGGGRRRVS